jgi:hypothetical protein
MGNPIAIANEYLGSALKFPEGFLENRRLAKRQQPWNVRKGYLALCDGSLPHLQRLQLHHNDRSGNALRANLVRHVQARDQFGGSHKAIGKVDLAPQRYLPAYSFSYF